MSKSNGAEGDKESSCNRSAAAEAGLDSADNFCRKPTGNCGSSKVALLIGINRYAYTDKSGNDFERNLVGPANDVALMYKLLLECGFAAADIVVLTTDGGTEPTRANILAALEDLHERTSPGATVFFFFAGHGSRLPYEWFENKIIKSLIDAPKPPRHPNNPYVYTIVPSDFRDHRDMDLENGRQITQITYLELRQAFAKIAKKTNNITLVFDCCHSAHILRRPDKSRERSQPLSQPLLEICPAPADGALTHRGISLLADEKIPFLDNAAGYVLFAACRENETAQEPEPTDANDKTHGIWTKSFAEAVANLKRSHNNYFSNEQLFHCASVAANLVCPQQHPLLEGARRRTFLSGMGEMRSEQVGVVQQAELIKETNVLKVLLNVGELNGAERGAIYAICAAGCRWFEQAREIAKATVTDTDASTSIAVLTEPTGAARPPPESLLALPVFDTKVGRTSAWPLVAVNVIVPDLEAFNGDVTLREQVSSQCAKILKSVEQSQFLTSVSSLTTYNVTVRLVDKNTAATQQPTQFSSPPGLEGNAVVDIIRRISHPCFAVVSDTGKKESIKQFEITDIGRHQLCGTLDAIGRFHRGFTIKWKQGCLRENLLEGKVTLHLEVSRQAHQNYENLPYKANHVIYAGDQMRATIENLSSKQIYFGLLEFAEDGEVHMLYPSGDVAETMRAGGKLVLGKGKEVDIDCFPPITFREDTCIRPEFTWKLFASTSPINFSSLLVAEGERGPPLGADRCGGLQGLLGPGKPRRFQERSVCLSDDHWYTVQQTFGLQKPA